MSSVIDKETEIMDLLERYEELMQGFSVCIEIHKNLSEKIDKMYKEISFIEEKLKKDGIKLKENIDATNS